MPAETELLVAAVAAAAVAAAEPAGKGSLGLVLLLVMSPAALHSCPERHPETCHTAFGSATETAAAVDSPKPAVAAAAAEAVVAVFVAVAAAAEFAVFGSVVGAACVAAVWPLSCQAEVVSDRTLWL